MENRHMIPQNIFTPRHIHHVINDLCTGGYPETLQRMMTGYVLSQKEQDYLKYSYSGETSPLDQNDDFESAVAEALQSYMCQAQESEHIRKEMENLLASKTDEWIEHYYNCTIADIPLINIPNFQESNRESYITLYAEIQYLTDAVAINEDTVYKEFGNVMETAKGTGCYIQKRNKELTERIKKMTDSLNNAEHLNTMDLAEISTSFYAIEVGLFRTAIIHHFLQLPFLPPELTRDYRTYIELQLESIKQLLHSTERLHREAWGKLISDHQHFVLQPFPFYYNNGETVEPYFIMRLNYNLALLQILYFSTRLNQPKQKEVRLTALFYPEQNEDMNHVYYFVNPESWSPEERQMYFLEMHFPVCYFHGSLQQLATDFNLSLSDFQLISADHVVAVYEWKTRLFIQLPRRISSEMQMSIIQHTINQYQEAIKRYKLLHLHHD